MSPFQLLRRSASLASILPLLVLAGCGKPNISGTYVASDEAGKLVILRLVQSAQGQITGTLEVDAPNGRPLPIAARKKPSAEASDEALIQAGMTTLTGTVTGTINNRDLSLSLAGATYAINEVGVLKDVNLVLTGNLTGPSTSRTTTFRPATRIQIKKLRVALESQARRRRWLAGLGPLEKHMQAFDAGVDKSIPALRKDAHIEQTSTAEVEAGVVEKRRLVAANAATPQFGPATVYSTLLSKITPAGEVIIQLHHLAAVAQNTETNVLPKMRAAVSLSMAPCQAPAKAEQQGCARLVPLDKVFEGKYRAYRAELATFATGDSNDVRQLASLQQSWNSLHMGPAWPPYPEIAHAVTSASSPAVAAPNAPLPTQQDVAASPPSQPTAAAMANPFSH